MRCPSCNAVVDEDARECSGCGEPLRLRRSGTEAGDGGISIIVPYKNVKALLAYYFGVFSLIPPIGVGLGPAAIILGILGLAYVRKNPQASGTGHAIAGIVLGGLVTLGYCAGLVFIVVAIATAR